VGTSGYDYPAWRGVFYPPGVRRGDWLSYAQARLDSIELNGTFYSLKTPASYERWRASVRPGFVFAVKGSQFITHRLRLREPRTALANFYASGVLALGAETGPFLWQLPERFAFEPARVAAFLEALPRDTQQAERLARRHDRRLRARARLRAAAHVRYRHALEPRHPSFFAEECLALLREHGTALVVADTGGRYPEAEHATADFVYARLHGPRELYASGYTPEELDAWAARVSAWRALGKDVYVYFDNDVGGHAPWNAIGLRERLGAGSAPAARGVEPSSTP
jgi:uncharacterized protein YecE (DUF72 family)